MFYQYNHCGTAEYFCKEYGENFSFPVHLHNSFEVITVLSGEMTVTVDGEENLLKNGESLLVFPNQLHSLESTLSRHMLCIFSTDLVKAYFSKTDNKIPLSGRITFSGYLLELLAKISTDSTISEKKGVLYLLCSEFEKTATLKEKHNTNDPVLYKIFEFVDENYTSDCSLARLSEKTGYSYTYLSRYFKKVTGLSFNGYVNRHRVSNACYLLNNTDYSVIQCALESGYDSLRSFNRNFAAYMGIPPSDYRNKKTNSVK